MTRPRCNRKSHRCTGRDLLFFIANETAIGRVSGNIIRLNDFDSTSVNHYMASMPKLARGCSGFLRFAQIHASCPCRDRHPRDPRNVSFDQMQCSIIRNDMKCG